MPTCERPGHSRSYPVNWQAHRSIHAHAEFIHAFIKTLGLTKPVITGCSIGGDITLDYAAHHWQDMAAGIAMEGLGRSPTFPSPTNMTHPSWTPGWQDMMERAALESLGRGVSAEKREELRWQHRRSLATNHEAAERDLQARQILIKPRLHSGGNVEHMVMFDEHVTLSRIHH